MANRTIDSFFKKRRLEPSGSGETPCPLRDSSPKHQTKKFCRAESLEFDISSIECDPGKQKSIWEYLKHQRDEVRRAYIKFGLYQPELPIESMVVDKKGRRFLFSWYKLFPDWLEFSPTKNAAFCLPCSLFSKPTDHFGSMAFTTSGFRSWKKVAKNRLQLQVSIDAAKWCAFQAVAFRGHDESLDSNNRVAAVVLDNAPRNASYTSPTIQKEILSIWSSKIQKYIREEISDSKFSILVDEAQDRSKREQMAIVLRFVDKQGYIRERFFDIVHAHETNSLTLKKEICDVLSRHNLSVQNIRGQGYDGASNMHGEWNGLQALFIQECPYAYYIHCFAHRLQLTLVATSQEVEEEFENKMIQLHYRIDVFLATVDSQILEMKNRFKEDVIELLILSSALYPKDNFQAFNIERICQLANKFYSANFTNQEKLHLRTQLELFQIEFSCNSQLQNLSSLQELCQVLAKTRKSMCYTLIDRLIRLILTLPVSTATTERAFSAMKMIKTCLHSRMEEDFLANSMIMYIEKEIARTFDINSIIDDFDKIKSRRAQFHMSHTVK
ncbi:uncharacterized protein [Coffea arabica]|uniref:TTF-type domain-containing protein n=1 Tax=Coffea arabica TaxID=13443 RepID=A0A6P6W5E2_COFAR|nr:zinc finger MYM-type protein 1-like [Coffea arabica]